MHPFHTKYMFKIWHIQYIIINAYLYLIRPTQMILKVYSCNNLFSYSYTIIRIFLQWPIVLEWYVLKNTLEPKCIETVDMMSHLISSTSTTTILFRPLLDRAEHTRSSLTILSTKFDFIYLWCIYQVSDLEVGRRDFAQWSN